MLESALSGEMAEKARQSREWVEARLEMQRAADALGRTHRGFRIIHRGSINPDGADYARRWQVRCETYEAALLYCNATGEHGARARL